MYVFTRICGAGSLFPKLAAFYIPAVRARELSRISTSVAWYRSLVFCDLITEKRNFILALISLAWASSEVKHVFTSALFI